eukprot:2589359-Rhodomonas_salina.2
MTCVSTRHRVAHCILQCRTSARGLAAYRHGGHGQVRDGKAGSSTPHLSTRHPETKRVGQSERCYPSLVMVVVSYSGRLPNPSVTPPPGSGATYFRTVHRTRNDRAGLQLYQACSSCRSRC